ncbi:MAG: UDP-N-acetylmuramoyl-L-alanyl-D-glutamate--2,6-diaminopimelate ligase [bacterium]|nr:UDP-N-acetylmuramoyl-L-alanyl-D-glutamate--2,6-diaminopimelate ligase [bacterium]
MTTGGARLSQLLRRSGVGALAELGADPVLTGATLDSRAVASGGLFFAVRGFNRNGEQFVPQAVERGAAAIVAAAGRPDGLPASVAWVQVDDVRRATALLSRELHGRPDEQLKLIGITGTNGKTTVTFMLEAIAAAAGLTGGRIGTTGYVYGATRVDAKHTTPEAPDLFRLLAEMRDEHVELVAMEVSSHALSLDRVVGARFHTGAFLNLTREHLDFYEDEEAYFDAKARLFDELDPSAHAVIPADSPYGRRLRERTQARVTTFGREEGAEVHLRNEHVSLDGCSAVLSTPSGPLPIRTFLLGRFNLDNAAAAAACALSAGLPPESIPAGILALERVPGRVERVDLGQPFLVVVDYAHTDDAMRNVLTWIRQLAVGRVRVLFGCGGDRDRGKRVSMGRVAAELADRLYLTADNPRSEDPLEIVAEIKRGVADVTGALERTSEDVERDDAIRRAFSEAEAGDVVLLAGKGHETTQTVGNRVFSFDDRHVATEILREMGWKETRHA